MKLYYEDKKAGIVLYHGDCREVLPTISAGSVDAIITDPPYKTSESMVPIRGGGVGPRIEESTSVGEPWGYSLDWIELCERFIPRHWIVYANYQMLGGLCSAKEPQTVFVWRKPNAPNMTRPVPRLDCEFVIWSRGKNGKCDRMGEFKSMVIDVPMPQAGCFATERILDRGTKKAAHPCQKPLAIVKPFVARLNFDRLIDPFCGTGTTLVAAKLLGRKAIGCEIDERHCETTANRLRQEVLQFTE